MVVTKLQLAAMSRAAIPEDQRKDFYLYVDEFQNFATDSFAVILSEARKYRLSLIVANQYIAQMDETVRDAVFGNVGTLISFRVGATDASALEREFAPIFEQNDLEGRLMIEERPLLVNADGNLLARVFENLLNNAVRYGQEGKYVDIHVFADGANVMTEVTNYDSLIEPEQLPFIFDMFYKIDDVRQSNSAGTGLGLAIAKNIIDLHQGNISAASSVEKTIFTVSLPRTS
jgi:light-regulated signal transduction histidine kinase (bacteriophytochrome)